VWLVREIFSSIFVHGRLATSVRPDTLPGVLRASDRIGTETCVWPGIQGATPPEATDLASSALMAEDYLKS
jgi:hypothetical protein